MAEKTKKSQPTNEGRHLHAVPEVRRPNYAARRAGAGILLALAVLGGLRIGADAIVERAQDEREAMGNATPNPDEVCTVVFEGAPGNAYTPNRLADRYRNGTEGIQEFSQQVSAVAAEHPKEGLGICHPKDDVRANHVVDPGSIRESQKVSPEQFNDEVPVE